MALFDFVKNIGEKLFNRDEKAAERIKERIEASNPGVKDLEISYDDGVVKISGKAKNRAAMEKTVLIAGNVKGVEEVEIEHFSVEADPVQPTKGTAATKVAAADDVEFYVIKSGDTLSKIAKRYYGDPMQYPRIFEANREVIKDADLIYPGQKIRIPKATTAA